MCQVKACNTELATTCPCMGLIATQDPKVHLTHILDTANEIPDDVHGLPDKSCDPQRVRQRVRQMLRARFNFSLPATSELLASYSSSFIHH